MFIVLLGLVRVEVKWPGTQQESHFVGVGGSVGILPSVIGRDLPGAGLVAAYGMVRPMLTRLVVTANCTVIEHTLPRYRTFLRSASMFCSPCADWLQTRAR